MIQQIHAPENVSMNVMPSATGEKQLDSAFTAAECESFHLEDMHAGKIIVGLMGGVFTMGLALYIFIACAVASGSH